MKNNLPNIISSDATYRVAKELDKNRQIESLIGSSEPSEQPKEKLFEDLLNQTREDKNGQG
jgi:hypothetical protein